MGVQLTSSMAVRSYLAKSGQRYWPPFEDLKSGISLFLDLSEAIDILITLSLFTNHLLGLCRSDGSCDPVGIKFGRSLFSRCHVFRAAMHWG